MISHFQNANSSLFIKTKSIFVFIKETVHNIYENTKASWIFRLSLLIGSLFQQISGSIKGQLSVFHHMQNLVK